MSPLEEWCSSDRSLHGGARGCASLAPALGTACILNIMAFVTEGHGGHMTTINTPTRFESVDRQNLVDGAMIEFGYDEMTTFGIHINLSN